MASLLAALSLLLALMLPAAATDVTNPVSQARDGVFLVRLVFNDAAHGHQNLVFQVGSGFLINDSTIVTCYHVTHLDMEKWGNTVRDLMEQNGISDLEEFNRHLSVQVVYQADLYMEVTELQSSEMMDFAILSLDQPISGHTSLTLRDTAVSETEMVYALGFPYVVDEIGTSTSYSYTASDVTLTNGMVTKAAASYEGVDCIQHNAVVTSGNSGGPLVDENGYVIGINAFVDAESEKYAWAIAIDQVIDALETESIAFDKYDGNELPIDDGSNDDEDSSGADDTGSEDDTGLDTDSHEVSGGSGESKDTGSPGSDVEIGHNTDLPDVDDSSDMMPIIIIAAAAGVLVIIIVVVVVMMSGKKGDRRDVPPVTPGSSTHPPYGGGGFTAVEPVHPPVGGGYGPGDGPATGVMNGGGATSVLTEPPETNVLSQPAFAALTRVATSERVEISKDSFVIGRANSANFYITGNSNIGRSHAKIVRQSGAISLVDLNSTNGTFLNGARLTPNSPMTLHDGDKIMLADETFTIKIF